MHIITLADIPATPWRNGGGLTRPLASGQAGRGPRHMTSAPHLDSFDWRISLAEIAADGPFSTFAGIDRHALLLGNGAVELAGPSGAVMARPLMPISFPGELELDARRQPGTVQPRFLNLMVRRSAMRGEIRIVDRAASITDARAWALLPLTGAWQLQGAQVDSGQAALGQAGDFLITPHAGSARAALVLVHALP